nr:unnamed protein product [Spirometra erinaceieuropaei]
MAAWITPGAVVLSSAFQRDHSAFFPGPRREVSKAVVETAEEEAAKSLTLEEMHWVQAGLNLIRRLNCRRIVGMSRSECEKIRLAPPARFATYVASIGEANDSVLHVSHPGGGVTAATSATPAGQEATSSVHEPAQRTVGVVVLDPLSDRSFGHPVFIFRTVRFDRGNSDAANLKSELLRFCTEQRGLVYGTDCICPESTGNCTPSFLEPSTSSKPSASSSDLQANEDASNDQQTCEFHFLPSVRMVTTKNYLRDTTSPISMTASLSQWSLFSRRKQLRERTTRSLRSPQSSNVSILRCVPLVALGLAPCPNSVQQNRRRRLYRRRVLPTSYSSVTEPFEGGLWSRPSQWLNPMRKREAIASFLPQPPVQTLDPIVPPQRDPHVDQLCSAYARCDYALLLASSWTDRWHASLTKAHVNQLVEKLRYLGYTNSYMSTFFMDAFASGVFSDADEGPRDNPRLEDKPSKEGFRERLRILCHTPNCVSTLFLYFNNFVLPDGDMLLWNLKEDGGQQATVLERYSIVEFLDDISLCKASLIFAVIDQNFAGVLLRKLEERTGEFPNLVVFSATRQSNTSNSVEESDNKQTNTPFSPFYGPDSLLPGQYDIYGIDGLLTSAIDLLPLSKLPIAEIEERIKSYFPQLNLGTFYGSHVPIHTATLFTKSAAKPHLPFLRGSLDKRPNQYVYNSGKGALGGPSGGPGYAVAPIDQQVAGCVNVSPIDWLRNYLKVPDGNAEPAS